MEGEGLVGREEWGRGVGEALGRGVWGRVNTVRGVVRGVWCKRTVDASVECVGDGNMFGRCEEVVGMKSWRCGLRGGGWEGGGGWRQRFEDRRTGEGGGQWGVLERSEGSGRKYEGPGTVLRTP